MYILHVIIFSLDEPNLMRILTVFKENLVKHIRKEQSRRVSYFFPLPLFTSHFH